MGDRGGVKKMEMEMEMGWERHLDPGTIRPDHLGPCPQFEEMVAVRAHPMWGTSISRYALNLLDIPRSWRTTITR